VLGGGGGGYQLLLCCSKDWGAEESSDFNRLLGLLMSPVSGAGRVI
jgi:hypothetical protein